MKQETKKIIRLLNKMGKTQCYNHSCSTFEYCNKGKENKLMNRDKLILFGDICPLIEEIEKELCHIDRFSWKR